MTKIKCKHCKKLIQKHLEAKYWFHYDSTHRTCADGFEYAEPVES